VLAAALALTVLNALKPLTADDPSYYWHVQQVAAHPLDPYGGTMFFREIAGPSVHNVAPPVVIYWLALGMRLTGEDPQRLKLWLLPFALLLTGACYGLLRRFAPGLERHGVWMVALSPAILPSLNLMLDVPALALSLGAVLVFLRAADRDSRALAIAAGVLTGLAIQTKYTGFTVGLVLLAIGLLRRRFGLVLMAGLVASVLFVGWEAWVYRGYGESQFLYFLGRRERGETGESALDLVRPLLRMLGPLASPLIPLGLLGLGARRGWVIGAIGVIAVAHVALALLPESFGSGKLLTPFNLTLGWLGLVLCGVAAAVVWRMLVRRGASARGRWRQDFAVRFLAIWLGIELLAYLFISTFPAARRTLGPLVVLVLIGCWLASRAIRRARWRPALVSGVVALSAGLGLFYFAVDLDDAASERATVDRVQKAVAARGGGAMWYVATSWGGFQFYAPRAGLRAVIPDHSELATGDWLVVPWNVFVKNRLTLADSSITLVEVLWWKRHLPLSTRDAFYLGTRPIRKPEADWREATLYRVVRGGRLVGTQAHPYRP